jgi:uncharacterized protein YodC (DUF2158 family)
MNNFRSGDIVSLRSGGVHMTVATIAENSVTCQWYNAISGKVEKETFFYQMLRPGATAPQNPEGVVR